MNHRDNELRTIAEAKQGLSEARRREFDAIYSQHRRDYGIATVWSVLFGLFGLDRFYLGQAGIGFAKLFTFGGFFIWAFIDLFLIRSVAADLNAAAARQIASTLGG